MPENSTCEAPDCPDSPHVLVHGKESQETLDSLLDAIPLAIVIFGQTGEIRRWNGAASRLFGWSYEEIAAMQPSDYPAGIRLTSSSAPPEAPRNFETCIRARDGRQLEVNRWEAPICDGEGKLIGTIATLTDITERKFLERAVLTAVECEKNRLGERLHQHLCQQLLGAAFATHALAISVRTLEPDRVEAQLAELGKMLNEAVLEMRSVAFALHPPDFGMIGLEGALRHLLEGRSGIETSFEVAEESRLNESLALQIYRVAGALIETAILQGSASRFELVLNQEPERFSLEILHNGTATDQKSEEIAVARYRISLSGGTIAFEPRGEGETIRISIPTAH